MNDSNKNQWIDCNCECCKGSVCDAMSEHASDIWIKESAALRCCWAKDGFVGWASHRKRSSAARNLFATSHPTPSRGPVSTNGSLRISPANRSLRSLGGSVRVPRLWFAHLVRSCPVTSRFPTTSRRFLRASANGMHCGAEGRNM